MIRVEYHGPASFKAPFWYVLRQLSRMTGLVFANGAGGDRDGVRAELFYGKMPDSSGKRRLCIGAVPEYLPDNANVRRAVADGSAPQNLPRRILYLFTGDMPSFEEILYLDADRQPLVSHSEQTVSCTCDLIATCFYMLNLEQENRTATRDEHGRFQREFTRESSLYDMPVVDRIVRLIEILLVAPKVPGIVPYPAIWPDHKPFAVALSHDVDRIRTWTLRKARRAIAPVLKSRGLSAVLPAAGYLLRSMARPENWAGNFKTITRMESQYGAASTFFFVQQRRSSIDPGYSLTSGRLQRGISALDKAGAAIGLHGTSGAYRNAEKLQHEKSGLERVIGKTVNGCRQHYLTFDSGMTWRILQDAGFSYDSTVGFSNAPGYRCGTGFPYHPWDPDTQQEMSLIEIPLVLMDTVLFLESKQGLSAANSHQVVFDLLEETRINRACLTVNWHNSDLFADDWSGFSELYSTILEWTAEHNGWLCTLDELHDWWRQL
ncbi:MAG: polysaccharide deacetylase family protein [candidate division KSB1 bacterium]|nr:polysaccharide deacetylase family protein [candidate division KSB1 bacterium]